MRLNALALYWWYQDLDGSLVLVFTGVNEVWEETDGTDVGEESGGQVWVETEEFGMAAGETCIPTAVVLQRGTGWVWVEEVVVTCGRLK